MISGNHKNRLSNSSRNHNNSSPVLRMDQYDFDDEEIDDDRDNDSDEDTEDASETEVVKKEEEYTEMKDQIYQEKLRSLKDQLKLLEEEKHPEYVKRHKRLQQTFKERAKMNEIWFKLELERVEKDYLYAKKSAAREFEEKKVELRENLIMELEDKKKMIEYERNTLELSGDSMDVKPVSTRKLRRRPNDPIPVPEKRRKTSPSQLNYLLDDDEILEDLKQLNKHKYNQPKKSFITVSKSTHLAR